jgi:hypothetical protein
MSDRGWTLVLIGYVVAWLPAETMAILRYVLWHPNAWIAAANVMTLYVYLRQHRSKMTRELDARLDQLRHERGQSYTVVRPLGEARDTLR